MALFYISFIRELRLTILKFKFKNLFNILIFLFFVLFYNNTFAQIKPVNSAEIRLALEKLNVLGSVMYLAAHPDDENTGLLAYMSKGKLLRTAYLSLSRGDGGQNLLGSEKGDLLGIIRTQELLGGRNLDGAQQFFTHAIDFGYSKTSKETLQNWDREIILEDVVQIFRHFRPDVIITRFSSTRGGHGHHLTSAILAEEAFHAAANPDKFPDQLKDYPIWQAKRIYWDTFAITSGQSAPVLSVDAGQYNPLLGESYQEIAALSRSMHKTQGFAVTASRGGQQISNFSYIAGDTAYQDLFDQIDQTWNRIPNSEKIQSLINQSISEYDLSHPDKSVPNLVQIYKELNKLPADYWVNIKKEEVKKLIQMCSGLWLESIVWEPGISPGMDITVRSMIVNRSEIPIKINKYKLSYLSETVELDEYLKTNEQFYIKKMIHIPEDTPYSQPYWLEYPNDRKMFTIKNKKNIEIPENAPALSANFFVSIDDLPLEYEIPVIHRWNDVVKGEQRRPFIIKPELSISIEKPTYIFAENKSQMILVNVTAYKDSLKGKVELELPAGWD